MAREHSYNISMVWTGNLGQGTRHYRDYSRNHEISGADKAAEIAGSSDPAFRGDSSRYNPEELLVAALSACHMLALLHLCATSGIVVTEYTDAAEGTMRENPDGSGEMVKVILRPRMVITDADRIEEARALHHKAHELCFIARSVNFPVDHAPEVSASSGPPRPPAEDSSTSGSATAPR